MRHLCGCVLNTRLGKREEKKGRCRQSGEGVPHSRKSVFILRAQSLPHLQTVAHSGMSLEASELGQAHSCLEKAEIVPHHQLSSPFHSPDRRCGRRSALGKWSVYTNFPAGTTSTAPQGSSAWALPLPLSLCVYPFLKFALPAL